MNPASKEKKEKPVQKAKEEFPDFLARQVLLVPGEKKDIQASEGLKANREYKVKKAIREILVLRERKETRVKREKKVKEGRKEKPGLHRNR